MTVTIDTKAPLYEFYKAGIIQELYRKGNPPAIYYRYYEVFLSHLTTGLNKTKSVNMTAIECGVSEVTIWKAIKAIGQ